MGLMRLLLRPWLPHIDRLHSLPPVPDPDPGPEYHQAMARAREAQQRAEEIMAEVNRTRGNKQTRPAM